MRLRPFLNIEFLSVLVVFLLITSGTALAHGTGYRILEPGKAVTIEFYYSDGTAMAYADTMVYSPENLKLEHQNGRTDKNGRVAFFPDTSGAWQVIVDDELGHKLQVQVQVDPENGSSRIKDQAPVVQSSSLSVVMGISLIFNLCAVIMLIRRKKPL